MQNHHGFRPQSKVCDCCWVSLTTGHPVGLLLLNITYTTKPSIVCATYPVPSWTNALSDATWILVIKRDGSLAGAKAGDRYETSSDRNTIVGGVSFGRGPTDCRWLGPSTAGGRTARGAGPTADKDAIRHLCIGYGWIRDGGSRCPPGRGER